MFLQGQGVTAELPDSSAKFTTSVGVFLLIVVPSPKLPPLLAPQQLTAPSSRITHECPLPKAIAVAVLPTPKLDV